MENLPTSKANSAAVGKCEAQGYVWASHLQLQSPLNHSPCVAFKIEVSRVYSDSDYVTGSLINTTQVLLADEIMPFYILDDTGMFFVMNTDNIEFEHEAKTTTYRYSMLSDIEQVHFENYLNANHPEILEKHSLISLQVKCVSLKHKDVVFARGVFKKTNVDLLNENPPILNFIEFLNTERERYYKNKVNSTDSVWSYFMSKKKYIPPINKSDYKCYGILTSDEQENLFLSNRLETTMQAEYGKYIYIKTAIQFIMLVILLLPILIYIGKK